MELDWGDGHYETTAAQLETVAEQVMDYAGIEDGMRVLDAGCGTGNAALLAAKRGALVVGVDPSARLLQVASDRASEDRVAAEFVLGDARNLSALPTNFDRVVAVFSIIFAPEPNEVVAQLVRRLGPQGSIVFTSWVPTGPVHQAARLLFPASAASPSPWSSREGIEALWQGQGTLEIQERQHVFQAASAEEWFADVETNHPAWRAAKAFHGPQWSTVRKDCIAVLHAHDEGDDTFRATSPYLITRVTPSQIEDPMP